MTSSNLKSDEKKEDWMLITHHRPPKGNEWSYQLHLAKYCGISVALAGNHRSLYCIHTFEHLLGVEHPIKLLKLKTIGLKRKKKKLKRNALKYLPSEQRKQTQWCHQTSSCTLGEGGGRPAAWRLLSWGLWGGWSGPSEQQNSPSVSASWWVCRLGYAYSNPKDTDLINVKLLCVHIINQQ